MHYRRADEIGAGTLMKQSNDMQKICQRYAKYKLIYMAKIHQGEESRIIKGERVYWE